MRKMIQSILARNTKRKTTKLPHKSKAQSLVEFAIALPVLLLLLSGVVEFGFALNYYLSLLDATRESARYYSNFDPFDEFGDDEMSFYEGAAGLALYNLDPTTLDPSYEGRIIALDQTSDEIIVTVYAKSSTEVVSYPTSGSFRAFSNDSVESLFTVEEIESRFESDSPNAGVLVVEIYYNYHQVMALPWLAAFVPDPLPLRAYTIMPLVSAEPPE
jgi:hypothetical protein